MFDLEELRRIYMAMKVWMYECWSKQEIFPEWKVFYGNEYAHCLVLKEKIRDEIFKITGRLEE